MTLREESLSTKDQPPFSSTAAMINANLIEQARIEMDTDFFLRKGGKVTDASGKVIEQVKTKEQKVKDEKRKKAIQSTRAQGSAILGIPHKKQITTTGKQNIHKASGDRFTVVVRSKSYGIYATIEEAVTVRDRVREESGMPKAEY